jgi:hypothetical protein
MATEAVTIPFEARDLISGSLRKISSALRSTTNDLIAFRRASDAMNNDFVSGSRRARESVQDFGRQVSSARDEVQGLSREKVDDIFSRARTGADNFRSAVSRAEAEIRGLSDARVHLKAKDDISPTLEGIHSKLSAIVATASSLVIGGGVKDSLFGGVTEYSNEAARSTPYLSSSDRKTALSKADALYGQGFFDSRQDAAKQVADIAPLVKDRSKIGDFVESSAKMKYLTPDASMEEINRALGQATNVFKETPKQVSDSMMYAYKQVGDRQQDLYDTFWEYSTYFKKTGASSAQMSNFLTKSVQAGSFNFDKPADFFKETFGVKALSESDMAKYFELRGSGKDEAANQAKSFVSDINSGDAQKAKGALMALVGDLASQKPDELKASLVQLGSATAEDNGDAILKTYKTAFDKPPSDITGTTDRMVKAQQDANPMTDLIQTRREMDLLLQDIGKSISADTLPVMHEFNQLLVSNKDEIQSLFGNLAAGITKATSFYKDHFNAINYFLIGIASILAVKKSLDFGKKISDFGKSTINTVSTGARKTKDLYVGTRDRVSNSFVGTGYRKAKDWAGETYVGRQTRRFGTWVSESRVGRGVSKAKSLFSRKKEEEEERKNFTLAGRTKGGEDGYGIHSLSSMTVQAARVYINGPISGASQGGRGKNARDELGKRGGYKEEDIAPKRRTATISRDKADELIRRSKPDVPEKKSIWNRAKDALFGSKSNLPETGLEQVSKLGKLAKGAGIVGAIASAGAGAYELYQASKKDGMRQAISTRGGAIAGGIAGGAILGAAGSIFGPVGTMAGAAAGNWLGAKAGAFFDSKGWTKSLVDSFMEIKNKSKDWWSGGSKESKKADDDLKHIATNTQKNTGQTKQQLVTLGTQAGQTANQTKTSLQAVGGIAGQGQVWGTTMMSGLIGGINSQIPALQSSMSQLRSIFYLPTTVRAPIYGPPAPVKMFADGGFTDGLVNRPTFVAGGRGIAGEAGPELIIPLSSSKRKRGFDLWQQAAPLFGVKMFADGGFTRRASLHQGGGIPIAKMLNQASSGVKSVTISNLTFDFGDLANQIKDFPSFLKMLSSPEARRIIENTAAMGLLNALENGG